MSEDNKLDRIINNFIANDKYFLRLQQNAKANFVDIPPCTYLYIINWLSAYEKNINLRSVALRSNTHSAGYNI